MGVGAAARGTAGAEQHGRSDDAERRDHERRGERGPAAVDERAVRMGDGDGRQDRRADGAV
jgi:hypothetical protein